jgi:hypothetical protein
MITSDYYLSISSRLVRAARDPADAVISLQEGRDGVDELCVALLLRGRFRLIYDPAQRLPNGAELYLVAPAGSIERLSAAEAQARLAELERARGVRYIHANLHHIRGNRRGGEAKPPIAVRRGRSGRATYARQVDCVGEGLLLSCPHRELPCGAKVFLAVPRSAVVTMVAPEAIAGVIEGMKDDMGPDADALTGEDITPSAATLRQV